MFGLSPWHVWLILGIIFVIIEILDPAFFFLSLGIGAILTALMSLLPFVKANIVWQLLFFAVFSFISFLMMRKLGKKVLSNPGGETNVYALKGKTGFVTKDIPQDGKGMVKIGGEEWTAVSEDNQPIQLGVKIEVLNIEGNKLIVRIAQ